MFKRVRLYLNHLFAIRKCPIFRKAEARNGQDGESVAVGPGTFAKGGDGGKGKNGSRGGNGGDAVALGSNSIAIGGRGGDAHR